MRRGESNYYDFEAVGITNTDLSIHNQSSASKYYVHSKTNEYIRKLDTRILAEQVIRSFSKEDSTKGLDTGQSDMNSDLASNPLSMIKNSKLVPSGVPLESSTPTTPTPKQEKEEKNKSKK